MDFFEAKKERSNRINPIYEGTNRAKTVKEIDLDTPSWKNQINFDQRESWEEESVTSTIAIAEPPCAIVLLFLNFESEGGDIKSSVGPISLLQACV